MKLSCGVFIKILTLYKKNDRKLTNTKFVEDIYRVISLDPDGFLGWDKSVTSRSFKGRVATFDDNNFKNTYSKILTDETQYIEPAQKFKKKFFNTSNDSLSVLIDKTFYIITKDHSIDEDTKFKINKNTYISKKDLTHQKNLQVCFEVFFLYIFAFLGRRENDLTNEDLLEIKKNDKDLKNIKSDLNLNIDVTEYEIIETSNQTNSEDNQTNSEDNQKNMDTATNENLNSQTIIQHAKTIIQNNSINDININ